MASKAKKGTSGGGRAARKRPSAKGTNESRVGQALAQLKHENEELWRQLRAHADRIQSLEEGRAAAQSGGL